MTKGAFKALKHIHEFEPVAGGTLMRDTIEWISPLGILGRIADVFIKRHLRSFLLKRNEMLKQRAEL
jgi:ligand-binding SRPBCC domain-containing protein